MRPTRTEMTHNPNIILIFSASQLQLADIRNTLAHKEIEMINLMTTITK